MRVGGDGRVGLRGGATVSWKGKGKDRSNARLALHIDRAAMALNDSVNDGESEAGALHYSRGEKGFETPLTDVLSHADAAVTDLHNDATGPRFRAQREGPASRHRVHRVEDQIRQHLAELRGIARDRRNLSG